MKLLSFFATLCLAVPVSSFAQTAPPKPIAVETDAAVQQGEPKVERRVIEDQGSRIEEVKVRGVAQSVNVKPKVPGVPGYQIIMSDGSRDLSPGANTSRGAAGQRVWHVMSF